MDTFSYWDWTEEAYGDIEPDYHNEPERIEFIISRIPNKNHNILEIGCCTGVLAEACKKGGNRVYAVDMSKKALEKAKKKGIMTTHGDFMDIKFKRKFDVIIAGEVLEHCFMTRAFLNKINSLLKHNGKLILSSPNVAALGRRLMLLCGINPMLEYTEDKGQAGHIRYTTRGNMIGLIKDSGFNVLEAKSDVVNFNASGTIRSTTLANWFPTLGRSILIYAEKK